MTGRKISLRAIEVAHHLMGAAMAYPDSVDGHPLRLTVSRDEATGAITIHTGTNMLNGLWDYLEEYATERQKSLTEMQALGHWADVSPYVVEG